MNYGIIIKSVSTSATFRDRGR